MAKKETKTESVKKKPKKKPLENPWRTENWDPAREDEFLGGISKAPIVKPIKLAVKGAVAVGRGIKEGLAENFGSDRTKEKPRDYLPKTGRDYKGKEEPGRNRDYATKRDAA